MGRKLHVGNLSYTVTESDLHALFAPHGTVESTRIITDRASGRSKGFGFVEMSSSAEAEAAASALNGQERDGRVITVSEAKPRAARADGGRSGGSEGESRAD